MLDAHNHVLFGLDDGCRTPEESAALVAAAKDAGHDGFIATPHIRPGMFDNTPDGIRARRDEARSIVESAGLELFLGAEYYFSPELLEGARSKSLLTLGETSRFVLIEMPTRQLPLRYDEILYEISLAGYVPVIAHPERCEGVARDPEAALEVLQRAQVLLQLDLGSLIGHYGRSAKKTSERLMKLGAYHIAACDLHRPEDVATVVAPSLKRLAKLLSKRKIEDGVERLTDTNPRALVRDAPRDEILSA